MALLAPGFEEGLEQTRGAGSQYAALHHDLVVVPGLGNQVGLRLHHAGMRLGCAIHEPSDARMNDRPGAHQAGLESDIERAAVEAVVAQLLGRGTQRSNLGMSAGIVGQDRCVEARAHDLACRTHHHRPHRHFTGGQPRMRLVQRPVHVEFVAAHRRGLRYADA